MRLASLASAAALVSGVAAAALSGCSAGSSTPDERPEKVAGTGGAWMFGTGGTGFVPGSGGDGPLNFGGSGSGVGADAGGGQTPPAETVSIDQCDASNPAGLGADGVSALLAGGSPGSLRLLYPYDGTVFPRGLIAPLLMWDGAQTVDVVYVHIQSSTFEYRGCLKPTGTGQIQVPQDVWDAAAANTHGASDPFTVQISTLSSGTVQGPVTEKVTIAAATLKGSIFYNSYSSAKALQAGGFGGAVLRISPGKDAEVFLGQTGCTGCHSVSANGSRLITDATLGGTSYALTPNMPVNPAPLKGGVPGGTFSGMFPDGSLYVTEAHPSGMGTRTTAPESADAALVETDTGAVVPNSGIPTGAMTTMFSPDGKLVAFNDYAIDAGHGLALMNFDQTARSASNYRKLYATGDASKFPGWPNVLPDDGGIVFAVGSANDFTGLGAGLLGLSIPGLTPVSDLFVLDVASGQAHLLAQAMGFATEADAAAGKTYLPFGTPELHQNFYPTSSPVAAGGYFWIFFDSVRYYGSLGLQRQLWGTAVDISADGTYTADPSHPAFYLSGQEFGTGNHRAFTALDPCHKDGDTCQTGIDCCTGFCTNGACTAPPPPKDNEPVCAHLDESCASLPCCDSRNKCLSGFCSTVLR
ncbi:MAG TPA: hypothetical protein VHE30_23740 [Polyangiaceae bacterium]|nr:hypothetical protein [Polyangiaceae bacterium]